MGERNYAIPTHLDDPPKIFFWDWDEALAFVAPFGVGMILGFLVTGGLLGVLLSYGVARLKAGRGRSFMQHVLYWYLPDGAGFKGRRTPPSHIREWVG